MEKLLTISSSYRSKGNGEALLDLCEKFLIKSKNHFDLRKLSLKDFNIQNCTGCMNCAVNKEFCKVNDDLKQLIDQILNCDVLIISSPVYFLGATSIIKSVTDRLLYLHNLVDFSNRKPAGIIVTAGRPGWEGSAMQNISTLLLSLGFYIKDVMLTHAQGPSEVLLTPNIEEKVANFSRNIIDPNYKIPNPSNRCPVCFGENFQILESPKIKCSHCDIYGEIIDQSNNETLILFPEDAINNSRWSYEILKEHMENWVEKSAQKYREKVKEIIKVRKKLLNTKLV